VLNGVRVVAVRDDVAAIVSSIGRTMHRFRLRSATMSDVAEGIWPAEIAFSKIKQENNDHESKNVT